MFKVCVALEVRRWLLLNALCDGGFQLFLWGDVHIPNQKGGNPSFPEIKVKRHGATILLFAFQTKGVWFMSARSLCHGHAGAAVECDPRLIPITTLGIDHISFVVTDSLPGGLLVFEPSHLASRPARAWCKNIVFSAQPEIHFVVHLCNGAVFMVEPLWFHLKSPISSHFPHHEFSYPMMISPSFPYWQIRYHNYLP